MNGVTAAERAEMREMAHQLARCELAPRAAALDAGEQSALAECWSVIADTGLDRALLEERHGGAELGVLDLLATLEELALGDGGVAMCVLLCNAALTMLDEEQLAGVHDGDRWALVPVAGDMELTSCQEWLDGRLVCALGAHGADGLVLLHEGPEPLAWAVAADAPGLSLEREESQMGLRAAPAATVTLQGVDGVACLNGFGVRALLGAGTAAIARGIARRAYELALDYAQQRHQGGVAIVEHEAVSDMLSAMAVRLAAWPQTATADLGSRTGQARALAAKIAATECALASATDAVQVFGGTGYMVETGVEKLMRDAKYCQLFPEPNWLAQAELMRCVRTGVEL
jgi:alkylation response protein AidB-like acyl-CoA dehydrogenase